MTSLLHSIIFNLCCWDNNFLLRNKLLIRSNAIYRKHMFRENFIHRLKHSLEFPQLILLPFFNRILNNQNIPFINYQNALSIPMSSILSTSFEYYVTLQLSLIGLAQQCRRELPRHTRESYTGGWGRGTRLRHLYF